MDQRKVTTKSDQWRNTWKEENRPCRKPKEGDIYRRRKKTSSSVTFVASDSNFSLIHIKLFLNRLFAKDSTLCKRSKYFFYSIPKTTLYFSTHPLFMCNQKCLKDNYDMISLWTTQKVSHQCETITCFKYIQFHSYQFHDFNL